MAGGVVPQPTLISCFLDTHCLFFFSITSIFSCRIVCRVTWEEGSFEGLPPALDWPVGQA